MTLAMSRRLAARAGGVLLAAVVVVVPLTRSAASHPGSSPAARASAPTSLGADLDRILGDARLDNSQVGLEVRDATTGDVLYEHNAQQRLLPASNGKLLTSTAAMDVLGADRRFTTSVQTSGPVDGHTLTGDLYLKGTGDPTMLGPDYDQLAGQVAASGVRVVHGDLVADDSYFDDVRLAPFWAWDDEPYYYDAQISALTVAPNTDYDAGTVIVHVAPGPKVGDPAKVTVIPANHYVHLAGTATTGAAGSNDSADAVRRHGNNTIDLSGSIPADSTGDDIWATVDDPTALVASLFRDALARHGVHVLGATDYRATPSGARVLASHESMTLAQLLTPFLKLSNNMHAEHLIKTMGAQVSGQGSWDAGTAAMLADVKSLGVNTADVRMVDGSGLSRADLISPQQITNLLIAARHQPWFATWYNALPIAGDPDRMVGGTLSNRMRNTPAADNMHAKTGSMTSVSALSGYVTDGAGDPLVFSMISNNFVQSGITSIENAVGVTLASYGAPNAKPVLVSAADPQPLTPAQRRQPALECSWVKAC